MAQALSPAAIASGTGRTWDAWLTYLESVGADQLDHQGIVALAAAHGAPSWWRQMIAVTYEQHIGRRVPGQRGDGSFSVSASRTLPGPLDGALARWVEVVGHPDELSGVAIETRPETTRTEKWRYWRCTLADGSRVAVNISMKAPDKPVVSVQHDQLESDDLGEHWRAHWKAILRDLWPHRAPHMLAPGIVGIVRASIRFDLPN